MGVIAQVGQPTFVPGSTGWYYSDPYPPWQVYYLRGQLKEAWNPQTTERMLWDQDKKAWVKPPVVTKPTVAVREEISGPMPGGVSNFGVDLGELAKDRPSYTVNGERADKKTILGLLEVPTLPADKDKPWLIAVGDQDFLKRFSDDLDKATILKNKVRYQGYLPDSWPVKKYNLDDSLAYRSSKKAVMLAKADGTVVHGQFDYSAGDLDTLGARFDPTKLPDLRIPERIGEGFFDALLAKIKQEPVLWFAGLIIVILLLKQNNK